MSLESCMILLDNSEYMRNGDYIPTRLEAQQDAANMLIGVKTQAHPQSTVGVLAGTEVLVSPTDKVGTLLQAVHQVPREFQQTFTTNTTSTSSHSSITAAVQVASLALKHRKTKEGGQRIILFVGSPVTAETKALVKVGKQLKKNNIALDVVALGELEHNETLLQQLVDAANGLTTANSATAAAADTEPTTTTGDRTSHLVAVPPGTLPSDVLASSPILAAEGGAYAAAVGAAAAGAYRADGNAAGGNAAAGDASNPFGEFGGVDPNMDPELAMALRVSMEEERARQERAAAETTTNNETAGAGDAEMTDAPTAAAAPTAMDEDALLQQALAMSMQEQTGQELPTTEETADSKPAAMETDEDAEMQMALQMSMQPDDQTAEEQHQLQDPAFVQELLGSMPGVDPNDPEIQKALQEAAKKKKKDDDDDDKKDGN